MTYCSKCGTKLSNADKYCPICGNNVGTLGNKVSTIKKKKQKNDDSLSVGQKIALGISSVFAFIGLCGGFVSASDGIWSILIVSIIASVAILFAFLGTIEKKYVWATAIGSFLAIFIAIGTSAPDEKEKKQERTQTEQKQENLAEKQVNEKIKQRVNDFSTYVGKWRLDRTTDDGQRMRFEISLKEDKSGEFVVFHLKGNYDDVLVFEQYPQCILEDGVIYLTKDGKITKSSVKIKVGSDGLYSFDNEKYERTYDR